MNQILGMAKNQVTTEQVLNVVDKGRLVEAIAFAKSLEFGEQVLPESLSDRSRVNEHELFTAVVYDSVGQVSDKAVTKFRELIPVVVNNLKDKSEEGFVLVRAVRRVLRKTIKAGAISRKLARQIRRFALGKSQLDSNRELLSKSRLTDAADDTPLRSIKTAYDRYQNNEVAQVSEHSSFKANMRAELLKKQKL